MNGTKYDYQQMLDIMSIIIDCVEEKIDVKTASARVSRVTKTFPVHNMRREIKKARYYLSGKGYYGYSYPAGWSKAFLEATNNNPFVIQALKEQQALNLKKTGTNNKKLEAILNDL